MIINNRHIGWGIIILIILLPIIVCLLNGYSIGIATVFISNNGWQFALAIEYLTIGIVGIVAGVFKIIHLCNDEICFQWHIKLPSRKSKLNAKKDFLKLGQLDPNSKEWKEVYDRMDRNGHWG